MSAENNLEECLRKLEKIRRKSLRRLAENCKSENMRESAVREIQINYLGAKFWIKKIYLVGHVRKLDSLKKEECDEDTTVGYFSSHLYYHLNQIRMLGQRH
jgi:hypothetical protein